MYTNEEHSLQLRNREVRKGAGENNSESVEMAEKEKVQMKIKHFNPKDKIDIRNWITYFNKQCDRLGYNEEWRLANISNFLDDEAFNISIELQNEDTTFSELTKILETRFRPVENNLLEKFNLLNLCEGENLQEFYFKKIKLARQAKIPDHLLVQSLINATPASLKRFVKIVDITSTEKWYAIMEKLWEENSQGSSETTGKTSPLRSVRNRNPGSRYDQLRRREEKVFEDRQRREFAPQGYSPARQITAHAVNPRAYRRQEPPYPCPLCEKQGILFSMHYRNECIFQKNENKEKKPPDAL